ncbi:MAG: DUF2238 domain-containing protein [Gammaproteobacteria bacterium]|nr:DUF2238 domain-containing protein [Gammaproteobacteria bacterium]
MKYLWITIYLTFLIWSGINPKDTLTWLLEVSPAIIGAAIMAFTYNSFRLTPLVYFLILIHCIILMIGGHYTYAEVPLFDQLRETFDLARNNYDKVGHFVQGFVPVLITREIIIRKNIISDRFWQSFFAVSFCLAFSAFYELIEWWVALISEEAAEAFLGTQGYTWDTQSDMGWALFGAVLALLLLSKIHDQQINKLKHI